jgi:hypothetical protein
LRPPAFAPLQSSFSTAKKTVSALANFQPGFKRSNKMNRDSIQTVRTTQDLNGDGDTNGPEDEFEEKFQASH